MKLKETLENYAKEQNIDIQEAEAKWILEIMIENLDENLAAWISDLMNADTQKERPLINLLSKISEIDNNEEAVVDACNIVAQLSDEKILVG